MPTVKSEFKAILRMEKQMKSFSGSMEYYTIQGYLNKRLSDFVYFANFKELSKLEILKLASMVGSYRPIALHTFFIYCAKQIND